MTKLETRNFKIVPTYVPYTQYISVMLEYHGFKVLHHSAAKWHTSSIKLDMKAAALVK